MNNDQCTMLQVHQVLSSKFLISQSVIIYLHQCMMRQLHQTLSVLFVFRHVWRKWWAGRGTYFSLFSLDLSERRFESLSWRDTQLVRQPHTTHKHKMKHSDRAVTNSNVSVCGCKYICMPQKELLSVIFAS